jgi:hypothetical protein
MPARLLAVSISIADRLFSEIACIFVRFIVSAMFLIAMFARYSRIELVIFGVAIATMAPLTKTVIAI